MTSYRVRVWLTEFRWADVIIQANTMYDAGQLGCGQSPIGKAFCIGEARYF